MVLCRRIVAVAALASLAGAAYGHDIPADVTVQALLKPDGQRLRLLVRVPLQAMRDMDYPKPPGATNPDLLDLARADATLRDAATLWVSDYLDLYEDGERLAAPAVISVRAALQSDKSFASYEDARAHLAAPGLPDETEFFWSQGLLDVHFDYPIRSERSRFSIQPRLARLGIRTLTVLRFLPPDGGVRGFEFLGDPGLVQLDPLWYQTALQFVKLGFVRIVDGADHLLFLVVLALPFRRVRPLVAIVTAFVVAHSIALLASASGLAPDALWFPPLVDTLTAASIVYMALENIVITVQKRPQRAPSSQGENDFSAVSANSAVFSGSSLKRRWLATFGFGLVHGFGLSLALRPALQLAGSHPLTATLSFNVGVELGLLLILALLVPAFELLFRYLIGWRTGTIVLSALCGHTAWHWMGDRWDLLRKFTFERPAIDAAFLAGALRWLMLLVVAVGLYWLVFDVLDRRRDKGSAEDLKSEA
jgi:HupE/UreJ protein